MFRHFNGLEKSPRTIGSMMAVTLMALVFTAACDDAVPSIEQNLARAQEYRDKGDLRASSIEAKNILQLDLNNHEARLILGLNQLDFGAWSQAESSLQRAMKAGGLFEVVAMVPLARAKVALAKYDDVLKFAKINKEFDQTLKAEILVVRGQSYSGKKMWDEARQSFDTALQHNPGSFDAHIGLSVIGLANDDPKKARAHYNEAAKLGPNSTDVLLYGGNLEYREKKFEKSLEAFQKLITLRPERPNYHLGKARALIMMGKPEEAIKSLAYPLEVAPKNPSANYFRALAAYRLKDYRTAYNHAEAVLGTTPGEPNALLLSAAASFATEQYEIALGKLKTVVERLPQVVLARQLLAQTQLKLGRPKEAYATLGSLAKNETASPQVLELIGNAAILSRDLNAGSDYLERVVARSPKNFRARALLATTLVNAGDFDRGITELGKVIGEAPNEPRAEMVLIISLIKAKRHVEAIEASKKFVETRPESAIGFTLLGNSYAGAEDKEKAGEAFRKAFKLDPRRADAGTNLASLAVQAKKPQEAIKILQRVLEHSPAHERAMTQLWYLEMQHGKVATLEPLFVRAVAEDSNSPLPRYFLGYIMVADKRYEKALTVALAGLHSFPNHAGLLEISGNAHFELKEFGNAAEMYRRLSEQRPKSAFNWYRLARSYSGMGRLEEAKEALEKVVELQPDNFAARRTLARLLVRDRNVPAADRHIEALKKTNPKSLVVALLEADLLILKREPRKAIEVLSAPWIVPAGEIVNRIAQLQLSMGQGHVAIKTLEKWIESNPKDYINKVFLGSYLLAAKRNDDAKRLFREILKDNPNSWVSNNEIAWTLLQSGNPEEALPYAKRARELAPREPTVADTLGLVHLKMGKYTEAVALLRDAVKGKGNNLVMRLHLAQALAKNKMDDDAMAVLREILAYRVNFSGRQDASALFKSLQEKKSLKDKENLEEKG